MKSEPILMNESDNIPTINDLVAQAKLSIATHTAMRRKEWSDIPNFGYFKWVQDNWTSRGSKLDFVKHKYLVDIYKDQHPFICWMKSAQTGGTERAVTEALWLPDQFPENSIYVFPTGGSIGDLVQERVDDPLNNRLYLRKVSGRIKGDGGKHADKLGLKRMSKGFTYFRGSASPTQITSVPADAIFADEVDRMPPENIPYIPKRLEHSDRRWQRWLSTPTIPGFGIHKIFLDTDQRYYNIKCNKCNEVQVLDFWKNVDYTMKNELTVAEAKLVCVKCREVLVPWECEAEWVATAESDKHGYHISKLYSPRIDLKELVQASLKTAEWELQQFYNQDLGLPYEPKGGSLTEEVLKSCVRDYKIPVNKGNNYMGVDVGLKMHVIIQNSESQVALIKTVENFEDLDILMNEYDVKMCVVDAMPETRKSQEFVARFKGRAMMCYYSMKTVSDDRWFKMDEKDLFVIHTNRTISLDNYTTRFNKQLIQLPKTLDDYLEFKEHMKSLTRTVVEKKGGEKVAEYLQRGPDHYYHAGNYSNLAKAVFEFAPEPEIFTI